MKDLGLMERIVGAVNEAVDLPVSMKMRSGWDENSINAPEAAQMAESLGLAFVAVHGRTRNQLYRGRADLDTIRRTKSAVSIPVVGNGDVVDGDSYQRMIDETGVDAVIIGRGCIGNPWIFAEIEARRRGEPWQSPGPEERFALVIDHLAAKIDERGRRRGVLEFRRQMSMYLKGLPGIASLRRRLFALDDPREVKEHLQRYLRDLAA
jgi:nifR3 family TIM-barrel protein